jgi:hypothetical protein
MYYVPPYILTVAGFIIALLCGKAFEMVLKEQVTDWSQNRSGSILSEMQSFSLVLPYLGIGVGILIFLGTGLMLFGFTLGLSFLVALPTTIATAVLIWSQLRKLLVQLEEGGSKALEYK